MGTVCFGVATHTGERSFTRTFDGNRDEVRARTALCALHALLGNDRAYVASLRFSREIGHGAAASVRRCAFMTFEFTLSLNELTVGRLACRCSDRKASASCREYDWLVIEWG